MSAHAKRAFEFPIGLCLYSATRLRAYSTCLWGVVLFGALASCEAALTEDAVVGRYIADTTPSLTVTMRPDGTFLEQIDNRQLVGQWRVLRVTRDGPHPFAGDVVELTGLMWSPAGEQTNERIHARLRKMPWRTALEWDAPLVRRLVKQ